MNQIKKHISSFIAGTETFIYLEATVSDFSFYHRPYIKKPYYFCLVQTEISTAESLWLLANLVNILRTMLINLLTHEESEEQLF